MASHFPLLAKLQPLSAEGSVVEVSDLIGGIGGRARDEAREEGREEEEVIRGGGAAKGSSSSPTQPKVERNEVSLNL